MENELSIDNEFNKIFSIRNKIVSSVSDLDILDSLLETHNRNISAIDFLREKISKCEDYLHFSDKDIVVKEELKNYKHLLFVLRFNDSLIEEQIVNYRGKTSK